MDGIATHLEATVAVALQTGRLWPESAIMELGCGDYSTPILAAIAKAQGRRLYNVVSDSNWAARFKHCFESVLEVPFERWNEVAFPQCFGMALMDNEQDVVDRFENLKRMGSIGVVVAHDAGHMKNKGCVWGEMKQYFKHVVLLGRRYPETPGTLETIDVALLSNRVDPTPWFHPGQAEVI